jgi:hypothetical protein
MINEVMDRFDHGYASTFAYIDRCLIHLNIKHSKEFRISKITSARPIMADFFQSEHTWTKFSLPPQGMCASDRYDQHINFNNSADNQPLR